MLLPFIEPPLVKEFNDKIGSEHLETGRARSEIAMAYTDHQIVHIPPEQGTAFKTPRASGDPEIAMQEKVSDSPEEIESSSGQDVSGSLDSKGDEV